MEPTIPSYHFYSFTGFGWALVAHVCSTQPYPAGAGTFQNCFWMVPFRTPGGGLCLDVQEHSAFYVEESLQREPQVSTNVLEARSIC